MDAPVVTHHTTFVNDVRLHYVTAGQGDPVVLLHGWPETWYQWRKIIPTLAERYTVIAPDLRGLGDSSKPATGYDKRTVANDIYQLVQKLVTRQKATVDYRSPDWHAALACSGRSEETGEFVDPGAKIALGQDVVEILHRRNSPSTYPWVRRHIFEEKYSPMTRVA